MSTLVNKNVSVSGHRTSLRLEPEMWSAVEELCHREGVTLAAFVTGIADRLRESGRGSCLTSAVRVAILEYYRAAATSEGHAQVGHGELNAVAA